MTRASARKTSCSARSWRRLSKDLYRALSFEMPRTRVMRGENSEGKEGCAIASLKVRWGSGVKRHIVVVERVLSECGRRILPGLSRFWSTMCFLVVTTSQIGSAELEVTSSEPSSAGSARRFFVVEEASLRFAFDLMCLRSAVEALRV